MMKIEFLPIELMFAFNSFFAVLLGYIQEYSDLLKPFFDDPSKIPVFGTGTNQKFPPCQEETGH